MNLGPVGTPANYEDKYRIVERGPEGHKRYKRFAVQRYVPSWRLLFFWTIPGRWEIIGKFNGTAQRHIILKREFQTWDEADEFKWELVVQDMFDADEWKECK